MASFDIHNDFHFLPLTICLGGLDFGRAWFLKMAGELLIVLLKGSRRVVRREIPMNTFEL